MTGIFKNIYFYIFLSPKDNVSQKKSTHLTFIIILTVLTILPFAFTFNRNDTKNLTLLHYQLPHLCWTKSMFNAECPGCGMTRSFVKIAKGEFRDALGFNRVSIILYFFFIFSIAFHTYCLFKLPGVIPTKLATTKRILSNLIVFLLLSNWFIGIFIGSNGGF